MAISVDGFSQEIETANILASAQNSGVPEVVALEDRLREGQIYLSVGEVFSTDLVENAFVSPDGVDLRGPLVLENLRTAVNLCNWLDTDTILRTCWALNPQLANELDNVAEFPNRDRAWVKSVFSRLTRENPPVQDIRQLQARYDVETGTQREQPRMLSTLPANSWLLPDSQLALRVWFITRIARDYTAMGSQLDEVWYKTMNEKRPITREEFTRMFQVQLDGIGRADRGFTPGLGNFFKQIVKGVSLLFKHPLKAFKQALENIGNGLQLVAKPLEWLEKLPYGHLLAAVAAGGTFSYFMTKLNAEFGKVLAKGKLTLDLLLGPVPSVFFHDEFKEQDLAFDFGTLMWQLGTVLTLAGAVVGAIPCGICQGLGAALAAIGALMIAIGQGMLAIMRALREQRLAALAGVPLPTPDVAALNANAKSNEEELATSNGSGSGGGSLLVLLAALALGG